MSPVAVRRRCVLALLLTLAACEGLPSLPAAPSDLTAGVSVYEHANFEGESALIRSSTPDLREFEGPCEHTDSDANGVASTTFNWNDCISSLRVAPGWRAIIHRDDDYDGQSLQLTADVPNLQLVAGSCDHEGLNDCVTSITVVAP